MNKKTKYIVLSIALAAVLGVVGFFGYFYLCVLPIQFGHPEIFVLQSDLTGRKAILLEQGFVDRGFWLYVPSQDSNEHIHEIGSLDCDGLFQLRNVIWSKDGSIVLCKGSVLNGTDVFTHAFDFEMGMAILPSTSWKDNTQGKWNEHSARIEQLVNSHGGIGSALSVSVIQQQATPLSCWEWRRFQRSIVGDKR
jgi:hypothetical protein